MTKAASLIAAILGTAMLCLAGVWLVRAALAWIAANREIVAIIQPWFLPAVLILVALGIVQLRRNET